MTPEQSFGHADFEILTFYPFISGDLSNTMSSGTFTLLGVEGNYTGPSVIDGNISGAVLGGYRIGDLTPSSFSFSGIRFTLAYESGTATIFDPYVVAQFSHVRGSVVAASTVPDLATWAMMLLGFWGIGLAIRQRPTLARA